jgi:hypothetical protein
MENQGLYRVQVIKHLMTKLPQIRALRQQLASPAAVRRGRPLNFPLGDDFFPAGAGDKKTAPPADICQTPFSR